MLSLSKFGVPGINVDPSESYLEAKAAYLAYSKKSRPVPITKEQPLLELLGTELELGIPEHKLPNESKIVFKENELGIAHLTKYYSSRSKESLQQQRYLMDHAKYFYTLLPCSKGKSIAICTGVITMPYNFRKETEQRKENLEMAVDFCKRNVLSLELADEWNYYPNEETTMFVLRSETPIEEQVEDWNASFRKWLLLNRKSLEKTVCKSWDSATLLEDLATDRAMPVKIQNLADFFDQYLAHHDMAKAFIINEETTDRLKFVIRLFDKFKTDKLSERF